jgi:hypothetical protein
MEGDVSDETLQERARRRAQDFLDKAFRDTHNGAPFVSIPSHRENIDVLLCDLADALDAAERRAQKAQADRDRLRDIARWFVQYAEGAPVHRGEADEMLTKARAALSETEGEE